MRSVTSLTASRDDNVPLAASGRKTIVLTRANCELPSQARLDLLPAAFYTHAARA
jgi:hypothetical protein